MPARRYNYLKLLSFILPFCSLICLLFIIERLALFYVSGRPITWPIFSWMVLNWHVWALFSPAIFQIVCLYGWNYPRRVIAFLIHLGASIVMAAIQFGVSLLIAHHLVWLFPQTFFERVLLGPAWASISWRVFVYFLIAILCTLFLTNEEQEEETVRGKKISGELLRTQLRTVKDRLSPSFVFQILDRVNESLGKDVEHADEMLMDLSDFLRYSVKTSHNTAATSLEELDSLRTFLTLTRSLSPDFSFELPSEEMPAHFLFPVNLLRSLTEPLIARGSSRKFSLDFENQNELDFVLIIVAEYSDVPKESNTKQFEDFLEQLLTSYYENKFSVRLTPSGNKLDLRMQLPSYKPEMETDLRVGIPKPKPSQTNADAVSRITLWTGLPLAWTLIVFCFMSTEFVSKMSGRYPVSWTDLFVAAAVLYVWLPLAPLLSRLFRRFPLQKGAPKKNLLAHLGIFVAVMTLILALKMGGEAFVLKIQGEPVDSLMTLWKRTISSGALAANFLIFLGLGAAITAIDLRRKKVLQNIHSMILEEQLIRARLQSLQIQLHPHFLFNCLNSLAELMHEAPDAAREMIQRLKLFLRLIFEETEESQITLEKELQFLEHYLQIQKVRFGDRLQVQIQVPEEVRNEQVPQLFLQPIVENCIRHGISTRPAGGVVDISVNRIDKRLQFKIWNSRPEENPIAVTSEIKEGTGLRNTRERLAHLYGMEYFLDLNTSLSSGTVVTLEIPSKG